MESVPTIATCCPVANGWPCVYRDGCPYERTAFRRYGQQSLHMDGRPNVRTAICIYGRPSVYPDGPAHIRTAVRIWTAVRISRWLSVYTTVAEYAAMAPRTAECHLEHEYGHAKCQYSNQQNCMTSHAVSPAIAVFAFPLWASLLEHLKTVRPGNRTNTYLYMSSDGRRQGLPESRKRQLQ
jgi:hypothetical protein